MKKIFLIFVLLFSLPSYAKWIKVGQSNNGDIFYFDIEKVKKHGEYIYIEYLSDLLKPDIDGYLSYKSYMQIDCNLYRYNTLRVSLYKESMGEKEGYTINSKNAEWRKSPPMTPIRLAIVAACGSKVTRK
ncbi:hypothetical protein PQZ50_01675 [Methylophilaceae bacterium]|nr:hypothetical protein [Methylophilaceae bacterium]